MAANKASKEKPGIGRAVQRELDQLRKKAEQLTARLQSEVKARELNARLAAEAKKAREQVAKEAKVLREQGRNLASQLKSVLTDADKRQQALKEAHGKITELRAELGRRTAELKRKSDELKNLAKESGHRAAEIIRGQGEPAPTGPTEPSDPMTSEPTTEGTANEKPTSTRVTGLNDQSI